MKNRTWMVRKFVHPIFQLQGPISEEKVLSLLSSRTLSAQDEIRPSNGYWVYLRESDELKKLFGETFQPLLVQPLLSDDIPTKTALTLPAEEKTKPDWAVPEKTLEQASKWETPLLLKFFLILLLLAVGTALYRMIFIFRS